MTTIENKQLNKMTEKESYTKADIIYLNKFANYTNERTKSEEYNMFEFTKLTLYEFDILIKLFDELHEELMEIDDIKCKISEVLERIIDEHKNEF